MHTYIIKDSNVPHSQAAQLTNSYHIVATLSVLSMHMLQFSLDDWV